jgi:hypothetical protein
VNTKEKIFRIIERYISFLKEKDMSLMYGNGFKFKIHSASTSVRDKTILFECVITFGDKIDESMMDPSVVDFYIKEIASTIYPKSIIKTMIRWDS